MKTSKSTKSTPLPDHYTTRKLHMESPERRQHDACPARETSAAYIKASPRLVTAARTMSWLWMPEAQRGLQKQPQTEPKLRHPDLKEKDVDSAPDSWGVGWVGASGLKRGQRVRGGCRYVARAQSDLATNRIECMRAVVVGFVNRFALCWSNDATLSLCIHCCEYGRRSRGNFTVRISAADTSSFRLRFDEIRPLNNSESSAR